MPEITYTVADGVSTDTSTLNITVNPVTDGLADDDETVETNEDTPVSGNVLDGTSSVDGPLSVLDFTVDGTTYAADDTATLAGIGTITIGADGAYTFTPEVDYNGPVPEITYTVADGTSTDTSILNISVTPVNDSPDITVDNGNVDGSADIVYESGLSSGSNASADTEFASGAFTISDPDGLADVTSVRINGTTIDINNLVGTVIEGSYGSLTITGPGAVAGEYNYTYTLTKPYDTDPATDNGPNIESGKENFTFTVSDGAETSAPAHITIDIVDDVPTAVSKEHWIQAEMAATSAQVTALASGWFGTASGPYAWDTAIDSKINTDSDGYFEQIVWGNRIGLQEGHSSYVFNDNAVLSSVNVGQTFVLGTFTHNNFPIPTYYPDLDLLKTAHLRVTFDVVIDGETVHVDHIVKFQHTETPGAGVADIVTIVDGTNQVQVTVGDFTYTLNIGFHDANGNTVTQVTTQENAANTFNLDAKLTADAAYYVPPETGMVAESIGADIPGDLKIVSITHGADVYDTSSPYYDPATTSLTVTTQEGGTFQMNFSTGSYSYTAPTMPVLGGNEVIQYTVMDDDGDTSTGTITFNLPDNIINGQGGNDVINGLSGNDIIYGRGGDDTLSGADGNDILSGGTGNNTLSGGLGADKFILSNGGHDNILDYSKAAGDAVDISSVLDTASGDYLNVVANADGSVKLEILNSGNVEKASVSFENISFSDLTPGAELDSLLGHVHIDPTSGS